jgi:hypothetical protein
MEIASTAANEGTGTVKRRRVKGKGERKKA